MRGGGGWSGIVGKGDGVNGWGGRGRGWWWEVRGRRQGQVKQVEWNGREGGEEVAVRAAVGEGDGVEWLGRGWGAGGRGRGWWRR